ncbi:flagellar protein FlgN [Sediminibacillus dalangtanensis]|uniref:Flagellar protein FlgN n=1 Tax=Sediminibacillus dalangtanensis TaxID=2729421 RepID=A0ABX7VUN7_9BACI|nr:flagellar protein FlgN [Sediminibacillus dalangtanensis]QTN00397.1 flagellar protein FlgN [Sediminibacillus dalangtanensis]
MSVQPVVESLQRLIKLHESLLTLSKEKTETLKDGDTDKLQTLMLQERKHVQAINQVEKQRQQEVGAWASNAGIDPEAATVSVILENLEDKQEKIDLESRFLKLTNVLYDLKQQENLNQDLTKQSLQFIQMSIDMMDPSLKNMNYGNTKSQQQPQSSKRSLFDSKA